MGVIDGRLQNGTKRIAKSTIARMLEDMCPEDPPYGVVEDLLEMLWMAVLAVTTARLDRQMGKERIFELHSDISEGAVATQLHGPDLAQVLPYLEDLADQTE